MRKTETLCWRCSNYATCEWSRGKPVKGWKATKTESIQLKSFCVIECPKFVEDDCFVATNQVMSDILNLSNQTISRYKRENLEILERLLFRAGYILLKGRRPEQLQKIKQGE